MQEVKVFLGSCKPNKVITDSHHNKRLFDNFLNRELTLAQSNLVYVAGVTYI